MTFDKIAKRTAQHYHAKTQVPFLFALLSEDCWWPSLSWAGSNNLAKNHKILKSWDEKKISKLALFWRLEIETVSFTSERWFLILLCLNSSCTSSSCNVFARVNQCIERSFYMWVDPPSLSLSKAWTLLSMLEKDSQSDSVDQIFRESLHNNKCCVAALPCAT